MLNKLAFTALIIAFISAPSVLAQDPISGAHATLSAATVRARQRQVNAQATEQAARWQAEHNATATASAFQFQAEATSEARTHANAARATADAHVSELQRATQQVRATNSAIAAQATRQAVETAWKAQAEEAKFMTFFSWFLVLCTVLIAGAGGVIWALHREDVARCDCAPVMIEVEHNEGTDRMPGVLYCEDEQTNQQVEALFEELRHARN